MKLIKTKKDADELLDKMVIENNNFNFYDLKARGTTSISLKNGQYKIFSWGNNWEDQDYTKITKEDAIEYIYYSRKSINKKFKDDFAEELN
jgi:hypothetical protein